VLEGINQSITFNCKRRGRGGKMSVGSSIKNGTDIYVRKFFSRSLIEWPR